MSYVGRWVGAAVLVAMIGCSGKAPETARSPGEAAPAVAMQALKDVPGDDLQARAETALRERRYYAPAGASAIDLYLALRERTPGAAGVAAALTELQPYLLIAGEQALARGDLAETQRLLALLARVDDNAPALPRLRDVLQRAQLAQQALAHQQLASATAATTAAARVAEEARAGVGVGVPVVARGVKSDSFTAVATVPITAPRPPPQPSEPAPPPRVASVAVATATMPATAMPRLMKDSPPRYPLSAKNRKIEGSVQIAFTIQPDGSVVGQQVLSASPAGIFDEAALAAVARWRFEASGRRVDTQRTLNFRLPKG